LGVKQDIGIHRPKVPEGWAFVGDGLGFGKAEPDYSVLVIKDEPGSDGLQKPVDYELIWSDQKKGKELIGKSFCSLASANLIKTEYKDSLSLVTCCML
jgi:hypothetical protein